MTGIQWTDIVWNPTTGCDRVSDGCDHCYAMTMAKRLKGMGQAKYQRDGDPKTSGPGFGLTVHPDALGLPLRWRKPKRVFVNSMSDLFHADVPAEFIARVFAVMAGAPQHTFQVLTKRHARMKSLLSREDFWLDVFMIAENEFAGSDRIWPLPNVWLGVSAEDQHWANLRIPALLHTPAAVRFVSAEPLLGPIDLHARDDGVRNWLPDLDPDVYDGEVPVCTAHGVADCQRVQPHAGCAHLDWLIAGGESVQAHARWT